MKKNTIPGRIVKIQPAGSKAVIATLQPVTEETLSSVYVYFIEIDGKHVPFFPESAEVRGEKTIIVRFEDYTSPEKLAMLAGCRVFIPSDEEEPEQPFNVKDITGFTIIKGENELIGLVTGVAENKGAILLEVETPGRKTILIPFHDDLVIDTDTGKREIKMELPEGLSGLND